jgi:hypothetical protein
MPVSSQAALAPDPHHVSRLGISPREARGGILPEICRFFGIVIRMFAEPGGPHHRPHFHAYYQDSVAISGLIESR